MSEQERAAILDRVREWNPAEFPGRPALFAADFPPDLWAAIVGERPGFVTSIFMVFFCVDHILAHIADRIERSEGLP